MDELLELMELMLMLTLLYEALDRLMAFTSRRFWVHPTYLDRDVNGFFALNFDYLYQKDPEHFKSAVRMDNKSFDVLYALVEDDLTKHSHRAAIGAKCRLFITLVYLANACSSKYFTKSFKIAQTTVRNIVNDTCEVLWNNLRGIYLSLPNKHEWHAVADNFEGIWKVPNCVGAIDVKQLTNICYQSSSKYQKGTYSIVLLGICDSNYNFIGFDVGMFNTISDGGDGIMWQTDFNNLLFSEKLGLPEKSVLRNSDIEFPYFFIGPSSFPMKSYIMRPYPGLKLTVEKNKFNKRLSLIEQLIENTFGCWTARWKILQAPLVMSPKSAENVIKATVVLHNFAKMHDATYCPDDFVDSYDGDTVIKGLWRQESLVLLKKGPKLHSNNAAKQAFSLRDTLRDYIFTH